jgi:alpha-N-arabinofuranosidase
LSAKDFYEWVEYCNAPAGATTLSDLRAAAGDRDRFGVQFWGIGNESWGCGGRFTPEEYSQEFRRFIAFVPRYGLDLKYIGAGPNSGDIAWTRRFFTNMAEKGENQLSSLYGWALHYYSNTTGDGNAIKYTTDEWYELIARSNRMESLIEQHWAMMGETDPQHRTKLIVDEWGAWHSQDPSLPPAYLFGYPGTLRDALISGLTLDIFNRHADKVVMANVAQLINTIHSLFLAYEDKFIVTPNFHVFEMYAAHQGGRSVRTMFSAPVLSYKRNPPNVEPGFLAQLSPQARARIQAETQSATGTLCERKATDLDCRQPACNGGQRGRGDRAGRRSPVGAGNGFVIQRYSRTQQFREPARAGAQRGETGGRKRRPVHLSLCSCLRDPSTAHSGISAL